MIDPDAREHRAVGIEHVYRVETSAQSDFQDQGFKPFLRKKNKGRKRPELEIGQRYGASCALDCGEGVAKGSIVRFAPGDAHAFVVAQQVGRSVEADAIARE